MNNLFKKHPRVAVLSIALLFLLLQTQCKTISVNNKTQRTIASSLEPGMIGTQSKNLVFPSFTTTAIPEIKSRIRVKADILPFNRNKFKAYLNASPENQLALNYIDSIPQKPSFIELSVIDRVAMTESLNEDKGVLTYLKEVDDASMITTVSMAVPSETLQRIQNAESVFLVSKSYKKYQLEIVDKEGKSELLLFSDAVVFAYRISSFCWAENEKHEVVVRDLIPESEYCPSKTFKKASKAKKEKDLFKF